MKMQCLLASLLLITAATSATANVCNPGARVTDRQSRSGTVIEAQKSDCKVRLDDGTERHYLAWMLSAAAMEGQKKQDTGSAGPKPGIYHCVAGGGMAGILPL